MAHQAVRNGPVASRDRQNNGVIEGVGSFGIDLATLAVLQMHWPPAIYEKVPRPQLQS